MSEQDAFFREILPFWVAATRDTRVSTGLSREEAFERARALRALLREGQVSAGELDEDSKGVLHALCVLLEEDAPTDPDRVALEARAIYEFIDSAGWADDTLDEKPELLRRCAEVGLRGLRGDVAGPERDRDSTVSPQERGAVLPSERPKAREEAIPRARQLRHLILEGRVSPKDFEVDEDAKDVLYALVKLVSETPPELPGASEETNAIYSFIRSVDRPSEFNENIELLNECAAVGWRLSGHSYDEIRAARSASTPDTLVTVRLLRVAGHHSCSEADPDQLANDYLAAYAQETQLFSEKTCPHIFAALVNGLSKREARDAKGVAPGGKALYWYLESKSQGWLFDEKDYVLGIVALIVGAAYRQLGIRESTEEWFTRAEERFNHTVTSGLLNLHIACERLVMGYEMRLYESVLLSARQVLLSPEASFCSRIGYKSRLIEALALKELNRVQEAEAAFSSLASELADTSERTLLGHCLVTWGNLLSTQGKYGEALTLYEKAEAIGKAGLYPAFFAHLYAAIGECLRDQGMFNRAVEYYRASLAEYSACGSSSWAAYMQVLLADALIAAGRPREAEKEIVAALPIIEERKLVQEGFAAAALLKESIRRRRMDLGALRALREHLKANK